MAGARLPELSLWFACVSQSNCFVHTHKLKSSHFPRGTSLHLEDECPLWEEEAGCSQHWKFSFCSSGSPASLPHLPAPLLVISVEHLRGLLCGKCHFCLFPSEVASASAVVTLCGGMRGRTFAWFPGFPLFCEFNLCAGRTWNVPGLLKTRSVQRVFSGCFGFSWVYFFLSVVSDLVFSCTTAKQSRKLFVVEVRKNKWCLEVHTAVTELGGCIRSSGCAPCSQLTAALVMQVFTCGFGGRVPGQNRALEACLITWPGRFPRALHRSPHIWLSFTPPQHITLIISSVTAPGQPSHFCCFPLLPWDVLPICATHPRDLQAANWVPWAYCCEMLSCLTWRKPPEPLRWWTWPWSMEGWVSEEQRLTPRCLLLRNYQNILSCAWNHGQNNGGVGMYDAFFEVINI